MPIGRLLMLMVCLCIAVPAIAQTTQREANLKAAFIYNFTNYIEWNNSDDDVFVIGVIGPSDIIAPLIEIAQTSTVKNKRIIIKEFSNPADIVDCNILFIPANSSFSLRSILDRTNKGMLTIGEEVGFAKQGTAFNFIVENDKLRFEANLKVLNQEGLKTSSQLLRLAKIVN